MAVWEQIGAGSLSCPTKKCSLSQRALTWYSNTLCTVFFMVLLVASDVWLSSVTNITLSSTRQFECAPTRTRMRRLLRMRSSIVRRAIWSLGEKRGFPAVDLSTVWGGFLAVGLSTVWRGFLTVGLSTIWRGFLAVGLSTVNRLSCCWSTVNRLSCCWSVYC